MRAERALIATLAGLLLVPGALAGYDAGSQIEADLPGIVVGRADALIPQGVVGFVAEDADDRISFTFTASEATLEYYDLERACVPPECIPTIGAPQPERQTVKDLAITLRRTTSAFKLIATNDAPAYQDSSSFRNPGPIIVSSLASDLSATRERTYLSPYADGWATTDPAAQTQHVYTVGPEVASTSTPPGISSTLHATKGFEALFQGMEVDVSGTLDDGKTLEKRYDTNSEDAVRFLVVEVTDGDLQVTSATAMSAFHVQTVDTLANVAFQGVTGKVIDGRNEREYDAETATFRGPLSLAILDVVPPKTSGQPVRMTFALSDELRVLDAIPPPDEERDPLQLVAAGAAGAVGAGLLASLVYFWPRLKLFTTLLFLPLYSRIERTAVLEHEKRDEIYELIRATPGIHAHEIGERARIGWGTAVYHLKLLENHALVVSKKSGRYKRFFVNTGEYTKKKDVYGALRNETARSVADYIVNHPGCSQKDLCAALGIQPSLASWHVEKLEGVELVKRVKDGRMVRYFAGPAWENLNVRVDPLGGADTPAET